MGGRGTDMLNLDRQRDLMTIEEWGGNPSHRR